MLASVHAGEVIVGGVNGKETTSPVHSTTHVLGQMKVTGEASSTEVKVEHQESYTKLEAAKLLC